MERLVNPIEDIYYNKTTRYTSKWSQYFDIYHTWFQKFVNQKPTVLEIGVDNGGSMETWHHYFGHGCKIIGVDNRPKVTDLGLPGTSIVFGDQGDVNFWDNFIAATPNLDIVIDDGSHFQEHQILTLEKLWPIMNPGGIYMVEDTHASYLSIFGGSYKGGRTFIEVMKNVIDGLHVDYFEGVEADRVTQLNGEPFRSINSIHFYDSVVVLEKGLRPKNNVTYSHKEIAI